MSTTAPDPARTPELVADPRLRGPIPAWKLERYALGELPPDELVALRRQIAEDPAAAAQLQALENDDRAIRMALPPARMAAEIRAKAGVAAPRPARPWVVFAPVAAMAAAVALALMPGPGRDTGPDLPPSDRDGIIAKGDGEAILSVIRQADAAELADGATVVAGDVLGFRYNAAGAAHGVLFSIDGNGVVTVHVPPEGIGSTLLPAGTVTLDLAYELDDAPDFERFFLVTGDRPIDMAALLAAARRLAQDGADAGLPALDDDLAVTDLLLEKAPSPRDAP